VGSTGGGSVGVGGGGGGGGEGGEGEASEVASVGGEVVITPSVVKLDAQMMVGYETETGSDIEGAGRLVGSLQAGRAGQI
jgi:hypothetical protein